MILFIRAQKRVYEEPELKPYADTILYDWNEGDEHWEWVMEAPVEEIVKWAKETQIYQTERDEDE